MKTFLSFKSSENIKINEDFTSDKFILDKKLSVNNRSVILIKEEKVNQLIEKTKVLFKQKYGKERPQRTPFFKRSIVGIEENTSLTDLHNLSVEIKKRYGIITTSIYTFHDLRYKTSKKVNHHAIMFHLFIDTETYKRIRLLKRQLVEIQSLVARALNMERGEKSSTKDRAKKLQKLKAERTQLELEIEEVKQEHRQLIKP